MISAAYAIGEPPPGSVDTNVGFLLRTVALILGWKIRGQAWPHPYFDRATGEPRFPVTVLSREERDAASKSCVPRPSEMR